MSTTMCHPGFLFATLVLQLAKANAAGLPILHARRHGDDGGDPCGDDEGCSTSASSSPTQIPTHSVSSTTTTSSTVSLSSSSTFAISTSSTPSSTSAVSPTTTPAIINSQVNASITRPSITTGGIIGSVVGSLILLGLGLMLIAKCVNRSRKSRKRPQGFVPSTFLANSPPTEMSQTQSTPIISSAVASRATSSPPLHYPHSPTSATNTTNPSLSSSPLLMSQTRSIASSSARRTSLSYTDVSSHHDLVQPLPSPYDHALLSSWAMNHASTGFGSAALGNMSQGASSPAEPSGLHRAMTAFQKDLEAEDRKDNETGAGKQDVIHDPPPKYDA